MLNPVWRGLTNNFELFIVTLNNKQVSSGINLHKNRTSSPSKVRTVPLNVSRGHRWRKVQQSGTHILMFKNVPVLVAILFSNESDFIHLFSSFLFPIKNRTTQFFLFSNHVTQLTKILFPHTNHYRVLSHTAINSSSPNVGFYICLSYI